MEANPEHPEPNFVEVANLADSLSAESVRACLEMEGIEAVVFDGGLSTMHGWMTNAFGGVKVKVPALQAERARKILATADLELKDDEVPENELLDFSSPHCHRCHSPRVRTRAFWSQPANFLARMLSVFDSTHVTSCRDCGHAWRH